MLLKSLLTSMFLLLSILCTGQLVNIESKRMQTDSTRFAFKGDLGFNYSDIDGLYIFQIISNITTQLKSKNLKKIYFFVGDYSLIRSEGQDFQNNWFIHFRYNQKISRLFRIEGFIQSQENTILDVNARNLAGAGIRLKVISKENFKFYFGNAYMYENEKNNELNVDLRNHRFSSYASLTATFPNNPISFLNTIYYQPLFKNFGDFRVLNQFKLNIALSEKFNIFISHDYFYDSITPKERSQYYSTMNFGAGVGF